MFNLPVERRPSPLPGGTVLMTHKEMGIPLPSTLGHHGGPQATKFFSLLDDYLEADNDVAKAGVETTIWKEFGQTCAPLILDMSGFSRVTKHFGILHYLGLVRRMQRTTFPLVMKHGGQVVKYEADNLFACFATAGQALDCAKAIQRACRDIVNHSPSVATDPNKQVHVSIGISWGNILVMESEDYYGDSVNVASKLGEDIAEADEILIDDVFLTQHKKERPDEHVACCPQQVEISHIMITVYNVNWQ